MRMDEKLSERVMQVNFSDDVFAIHEKRWEMTNRVENPFSCALRENDSICCQLPGAYLRHTSQNVLLLLFVTCIYKL